MWAKFGGPRNFFAYKLVTFSPRCMGGQSPIYTAASIAFVTLVFIFCRTRACTVLSKTFRWKNVFTISKNRFLNRSSVPRVFRVVASSDEKQEMNHEAKNASTEEGKPVAATANPCRGEWSTPKNCDVGKGQCEYHIRWSYSTRTDYITFTISTTHTDLWTGVGFSDDHKMVRDCMFANAADGKNTTVTALDGIDCILYTLPPCSNSYCVQSKWIQGFGTAFFFSICKTFLLSCSLKPTPFLAG